MSIRSFRHLTAITTLALTSLAGATACSSTPVRAVPLPSPATMPSTTTPSTPTAPISTTKPGNAPPACLGAVIYKIDAASSAPPWPTSLCISVGGVVWISHLGIGDLSVDPRSKVDCNYEAAENPCRLIATGTVTFKARGSRPVTVKVVEAANPPLPSSACDKAGTYTLDAAEDGPFWWSRCMKVDSVLRLTNVAPDGLAASPADAVSCTYAAGVYTCRFRKAATVTFTLDAAQHSLIVVAIK
jgi:hypothetical protein